MTIENVEGIVWDLDGTLVDSFAIFETIVADVVAESGHEMPSREKIVHNYHGSLEETLQSILGISSVSELNEIVNKFLEKQEHHYGNDLETHLYEDALLLSQRAAIRGIKQIVVTNRSHAGRGTASPKHIIATTTLADSIMEVRPRDEVEFPKPDKRSLGDWSERHSLEPKQIVVIGDQVVDARLAIDIGARAVIIKRNGFMPHIETLESNNDVTLVNNLHELELT